MTYFSVIIFDMMYMIPRHYIMDTPLLFSGYGVSIFISVGILSYYFLGIPLLWSWYPYVIFVISFGMPRYYFRNIPGVFAGYSVIILVICLWIRWYYYRSYVRATLWLWSLLLFGIICCYFRDTQLVCSWLCDKYTVTIVVSISVVLVF